MDALEPSLTAFRMAWVQSDGMDYRWLGPGFQACMCGARLDRRLSAFQHLSGRPVVSRHLRCLLKLRTWSNQKVVFVNDLFEPKPRDLSQLVVAHPDMPLLNPKGPELPLCWRQAENSQTGPKTLPFRMISPHQIFWSQAKRGSGCISLLPNGQIAQQLDLFRKEMLLPDFGENPYDAALSQLTQHIKKALVVAHSKERLTWFAMALRRLMGPNLGYPCYEWRLADKRALMACPPFETWIELDNRDQAWRNYARVRGGPYGWSFPVAPLGRARISAGGRTWALLRFTGHWAPDVPCIQTEVDFGDLAKAHWSTWQILRHPTWAG